MQPTVWVEIGSHRIGHRGPGPWKAERFGNGAACVTNALGVNWLTGLGGATLLCERSAEAVAAALNGGAQ